MASQFYVSGPAQVWTGTGAASAFEYLGYTESGITVAINGIFEDVPADFAGGMPGDVIFLGQDANFGGTFVKYNEGIATKALSFLNGDVANIGAGALGDVGSLLVTEGYSTPVVVKSPYGFKDAYSGTMVAGFYFPAAYLNNPYSSLLNVRNKKIDLSWRAIPVYASAPFLAYVLYSLTLPSVPDPN